MAKRKGESHGVTTVAEPIAPAPMTVIGNCSFSGGHKSNCRQNRVLSINDTSNGWEEKGHASGGMGDGYDSQG
jgi:hypothetical protein